MVVEKNVGIPERFFDNHYIGAEEEILHLINEVVKEIK